MLFFFIGFWLFFGGGVGVLGCLLCVGFCEIKCVGWFGVVCYLVPCYLGVFVLYVFFLNVCICSVWLVYRFLFGLLVCGWCVAWCLLSDCGE